MPLILIFIFVFSNGFSDDFITHFEYGQMLYQNPRGIGCHECHGLKGKGKPIVTYKENGKTKKILAPEIYSLPKKRFFEALYDKKAKLMPKYFLTKDEVQSLYDYLRAVNVRAD
ncbi:MAG: cytochrome C oxidase subunit III [Proteobacteria bacterium]|nr:MAG: cytochrome C oxidase subunit III [Pseudomonadota bacterium]